MECLRGCGGGEGVRRRLGREDGRGSGAAPFLEACLELDSDGVVLADVVLLVDFCLVAPTPAGLLDLPFVSGLALGVLPFDPFIE